jgi:hypothetical protein
LDDDEQPVIQDGQPVMEKVPVPWWECEEYVALAKAHHIFIGFKSAGDVIHQYKIVHNGDVRDTLTQKAQIESFLFNQQKPKQEWENKSGTMSQWIDVHNHSESMCGHYYSIWDIYKNTDAHGHFDVRFSLQVGFDDLLIFQAFELFPSCALGELELVIMCSPDALVWCSVDPKVSIPEYLECGNLNPYDVGQDSMEAQLNDLHRDKPQEGNDGKYSTFISTIYNAGNSITPITSDTYYDRRFIQAYQEGRCATNIFRIKGTNSYSYGFKDIKMIPH